MKYAANNKYPQEHTQHIYFCPRGHNSEGKTRNNRKQPCSTPENHSALEVEIKCLPVRIKKKMTAGSENTLL